jgi:hypothetical protein
MCYKWTQMVQLVKSYKKHLKIGSIQIFWIEGACITFNRLFSTTLHRVNSQTSIHTIKYQLVS